MSVIVQPGFFVIVLAGKPQIVLNGGYGNIGLAEWQVVGGPDHGTAGVGHLLGRAQVGEKGGERVKP